MLEVLSHKEFESKNQLRFKLFYFRLKVRIGDTDHASAIDDDGVQILDILQVQVHPNYNQDMFYFDVAVIRTKPVDMQPGKIFFYFGCC